MEKTKKLDSMKYLMGKSLKEIKNSLNLKIKDFEIFLGITRQSVTNLMNQSQPISQLQLMAICNLLDFVIKNDIEKKEQICNILNSNSNKEHIPVFNSLPISFSSDFQECINEEFNLTDSCKKEISSKLDTSSFKELLDSYRIIIDVTSISLSNFEETMKNYEMLMHQNNAYYLFLKQSFQMIKKTNSSNYNFKRKSSQQLLKLIVSLKEDKNLLKFIKISNNKSTNQSIVDFILNHKDESKFMVITQDPYLANDILFNFTTEKQNEILVYKITSTNEIIKFSKKEISDSNIITKLNSYLLKNGEEENA